MYSNTRETTPATTSTAPRAPWALLMRQRRHKEHRPQRPSERIDPTQHAKGRTGDCPGLRKETATRRDVTRGLGGWIVALPLVRESVPRPPDFTEDYEARGTRATHEAKCAGTHVGMAELDNSLQATHRVHLMRHHPHDSTWRCVFVYRTP